MQENWEATSDSAFHASVLNINFFFQEVGEVGGDVDRKTSGVYELSSGEVPKQFPTPPFFFFHFLKQDSEALP